MLTSEGKTRQGISHLSPRRRTAILRRAAYRALPNVALGLAVAYAVFAPVPVLRSGLRAGGMLAACTVLGLIAMLLLRQAVLQRRLSHHVAHQALGVALSIFVLRGLL